MTEKTSRSSNLYLFYGEDDFSLKRKLDFWKAEFAKKYGASSIAIIAGEDMSETELVAAMQTHLARSLFSSKKLIIIKNGLPQKAAQTVLADFLLAVIPTISPDFFVIFVQAKLDRRLSFTKKFLAAGITETEFTLPHGLVLNQWITAMAKTLGCEITPAAADRLAQFLGRDLFEEKKIAGRVVERKEAYDLWQVYTELMKLGSFSSKIEPQMVSNLVKPKIPDSVFALTDEMIAHNTKGAFTALENFLASAPTEDKTAFIKIVGLLSEQLRSLLIVSLLAKAGDSNDEIAEKLGWSTGRVFVTAKNLKNVSADKLKQLLNQLLIIDLRLKSQDINPKLEIDQFLVSATN